MIKVPLNFYTDRAAAILTEISYTMLNSGTGVSSKTWVEYVTTFTREPNGQVNICINDNSWQFSRSSWRTRRDPKSIKQFFRGQFMQAIQDTMQYVYNHNKSIWPTYDDARAHLWTTKCTDFTPASANIFNPHSSVYNVTFGDLKAIYYALSEIKQLKTKCTKTQLEELIGQPRDPFQTEMERVRREEIENITLEYNTKIDSTYILQNDEIKKIKDEIYVKYAAMRKAYEEERDKKIKELTNMCNNMAFMA